MHKALEQELARGHQMQFTRSSCKPGVICGSARPLLPTLPARWAVSTTPAPLSLVVRLRVVLVCQ